MNFSLKIILISLVFCCDTNSGTFGHILGGVSIHPVIVPLAQVLKDIINVYFVKEKSPLDIYILTPFPGNKALIFSELLNNNNETFSYIFQVFYTHRNKLQIKVSHSAIFIIYDVDDISEVLKFSATRYQNQAIKYFIYINGATFEKLKNSKHIKWCPQLTIMPGTILHHSYFIVNERNVISLSTIEWFVKKCNMPHLIKFNAFDKKSMTWIRKFEVYEKFLNYNGCELVLMLPYLHSSGISTNHWGFSYLDEKSNIIKAHGLTPVLFKIVAEKFNFQDAFCPVEMNESNWIRDFNLKQISPLIYKKDFKIPTVYFDILGTSLYEASKVRISNSFLNGKVKLLVPSSHTYNQYEKLFLVFDLTTWILLGTTLMTYFCVLQIINWMIKYSKNLPTQENFQFFVSGLFIGFTKVRLSHWKSVKIVFICFSMLCLIFQIFFQNISFAFLTSQPHYTKINSLQDLVDLNFTIKVLYKEEMMNVIGSDLEKWPEIEEISESEMIDIYSYSSRNYSAKTALLLEELYLKNLEYNTQVKWKNLELNDKVVFQLGYAFQQHSFSFRMLHKTVNSLINTGIMNHLVDLHLEAKDLIEMKEKAKLLDINDLLSGFIIWMGLCGISIMVFLIEFLLLSKSINPVVEN